MPALLATCMMDTKLVKASAWLLAAKLGYSTINKLQEGYCQLATVTRPRICAVCSQRQPHPIINNSLKQKIASSVIRPFLSTMYEGAVTPDYSFSTKIRVPKNTYPVHTEHTLQFRVLHVQWVPRLVLHSTRKTGQVCIRTCTHITSKLLQHKNCQSSPEGVVCCYSSEGNISKPLRLIWKGMNCSVCTAHWMQQTMHTGGI